MKKFLILPLLLLAACDNTTPECWSESTQTLVKNILKDADTKQNKNVNLSKVAEIRVDSNNVRYCDADVEKASIAGIKLKSVGYTVKRIRMEGGWGQQVQIIRYNNIDIK
ncbi:MAG: hypothetical protein FWF23_01745 [Alphaproteobacteria bacterium]|nr:hypothetical protein [Alphaproteobacteria bacterium]MCL2504645.1 hypothetical protein [Alphaproteobacteria bacterium]